MFVSTVGNVGSSPSKLFFFRSLLDLLGLGFCSKKGQKLGWFSSSVKCWLNPDPFQILEFFLLFWLISLPLIVKAWIKSCPYKGIPWHRLSLNFAITLRESLWNAWFDFEDCCTCTRFVLVSRLQLELLRLVSEVSLSAKLKVYRGMGAGLAWFDSSSVKFKIRFFRKALDSIRYLKNVKSKICEFGRIWDFEHVNFVKNETLKIRILWKMIF